MPVGHSGRIGEKKKREKDSLGAGRLLVPPVCLLFLVRQIEATA